MADKKSTRPTKEIEAEIAATRSRLARTVDELAYRVSPDTLKSKAKARVDNKINTLVGRAKGTVVDPDGDLRLEAIAKALGGVAAGALALGVLRRVFHRG